jgi:hypothetical protein
MRPNHTSFPSSGWKRLNTRCFPSTSMSALARSSTA